MSYTIWLLLLYSAISTAPPDTIFYHILYWKEMPLKLDLLKAVDLTWRLEIKIFKTENLAGIFCNTCIFPASLFCKAFRSTDMLLALQQNTSLSFPSYLQFFLHLSSKCFDNDHVYKI